METIFLSISEGTGSCGYLFHKILGEVQWSTASGKVQKLNLNLPEQHSSAYVYVNMTAQYNTLIAKH